jgi:hypothetical protein
MFERNGYSYNHPVLEDENLIYYMLYKAVQSALYH